MKCDICGGDVWVGSSTGTCSECLQAIIANSVPDADDEEDERECSMCGQLMRYDPLKNSDLCLYCSDLQPDEPEQGDWFTADYVTFHEWEGKGLVIAGDDWQKTLREYMDAEKFWPSVWFISDHGNAHLLQMEKPTNEDP